MTKECICGAEIEWIRPSWRNVADDSWYCYPDSESELERALQHLPVEEDVT